MEIEAGEALVAKGERMVVTSMMVDLGINSPIGRGTRTSRYERARDTLDMAWWSGTSGRW